MAGQNMDQFEAYFRRADLDQDGRISGSEAVAFFKGSNLPQQVLSQIWTYADQNRTGFLGRGEFYNALKLVTVAQKRALTPDIVKAALYGPASAKIPVPQINLAALPASQSNFSAGAPVTQLSAATPPASQTTGIRGPQNYLPQQTQFMSPPRPPLPGSGFQPQQYAASQGMPRGGTVAAPRPATPNLSPGLLGGRAGGSPAGVISQVPNRGGVGTSSTSQDGLGLAAFGATSLTQPTSQGNTGLVQPAASKQNDKSLSATGNGLAADLVFGDGFSLTSARTIPVSVSSAGGLPASAVRSPASAESQPAVNSISNVSLQSTHSQNSLPSQHQEVQATVKETRQVPVQNSFALPAGAGSSASGQTHPWPRMTQSDVQKYTKVFLQVDKDRDGKLTGEQARNLFLSWRLPQAVLKQVWDLSDQDKDSMLSLKEFCIALYLMERFREGRPLPTVLPDSIMFDETLLHASGQPAATYGNVVWRPSPGLQQLQGTMNASLVVPAAGVRPPGPVSLPHTDESVQPSKQRPKVPLLEKHLVDQLSSEEQNSLISKFQEATDAEKKVEELEKEILESKQKIEFYRGKMQELILYKSRCDNRLNEITERVSADKREVESLAKKYEEKYRQVGDVASKLTIEEATFRDIQEKRMELYRAILKMEQDGSGDGIQDRADHIRSELEKLVRSLNERCKTYGLRAKPTSVVELPFGWQAGIQGGAADWDEDWDKFEDEGFTFVKELTLDGQNVVAPPKPRTLLLQNENSFVDEGETTTATSSATNGKVEKLRTAGEETSDDELANSRGESNGLDSPSGKFQDSPSRTNMGVYDSPHATEIHSEHGGADSVLSGEKGFDEPSWGAFDSNYDTDSAWDFNPSSNEDMGLEQHKESSLFTPDNWSLNPIRTDSRYTDNLFQNKNTFTFDSVPSTPIINSGTSPHADTMFQNKSSQFAFADSVPSTPMYSSSYNSPRKFNEDNSFGNFSRFDSFGSTQDGGLFQSRETLTRFDSIRSNRDSEYDYGFFQPRETLTRFDSIRSTTTDSDYNHRFPAFDDTADPFGSSDPFKASLDGQSPRRDSNRWRAF